MSSNFSSSPNKDNESIAGARFVKSGYHTTYLTSGPVLSRGVTHAKGCRCGNDPSFQDALACALTSDRWLDELFHRLEGASAAPSVLHLAKRLRDLENTKDRQIANFTRQD